MMHGRWFSILDGCFGYGYYGIWHFLMMGGFTLLVVGLIIWSIKKSKATSDDQALNLLRQRYALGEITEEEYLHKRNALNRK